MEVIIPNSAMDFDFNSARSSPYLTTPSTPKRFGEVYFSAPTSPTRISELYGEFNDFSEETTRRLEAASSSSIPFKWEEKPGTPKLAMEKTREADDFEFEFNFSVELETASLSAEELFDGGVIRPLKPPPRLEVRSKVDEHRGKKTTREPERGRERTVSSSSRRGTRSVSPMRVSECIWEEQNMKQSSLASKPPPSSTAIVSSSSSSKASKKWSFKDFLLFRSASEGRATDKDPFRKYATLFRKSEDAKNASFRSIDSPGSVSRSRRKGPVSAHELHYTMNRAVSEDLKKKTFLPYKQGILGRLAFNPAIHALTNGFGSITRG